MIEKYIKDKLDRLWDKALEHSRESRIPDFRVQELHPSSFPYCGLRHLYMQNNYPESLEIRVSNMASDFYTEIGTLVHAFVQDYIGTKVSLKNIRFYGNATCTKCGKHVKRKHKKSLQKRSKSCKHSWEYVELPIKYGKNIRGKIDGLIRFKYEGKYYWLVFDLKTAMGRKIYMNSSKKENTLPTALNVEQIEAYCIAIEKMYKIKIWGHILLYKSRETHYDKFISVVRLTSKDKVNIKKRLKTYDRSFSIVNSKASTKEKFKSLYRIKPCDSRLWYDSNMRNPYDKVCPLAKQNKCFNKSTAYSAVKKG